MNSIAIELTAVSLPSFEGRAGDNLYMIPFTKIDMLKIPVKYREWLENAMKFIPDFLGAAYLTVDQKLIHKAGKHHRRSGIHIDGNYIVDGWGSPPGWLNGMSGIMNSPESHKEMYLTEGMGTLLASDYSACQVWEGIFEGQPSHGGNCEHLQHELTDKKVYLLKPNKLYWLSHGCVHESLPIDKVTKRTMIRITLPIN